MFKFTGTLSDLRNYLDATFTKHAQKTLLLGVFTQGRSFQAHGTRKEIAAMLALVYTTKHIKTMTLEVEIHQSGVTPRTGYGRVLTMRTEEWPTDLCVDDVHATIKSGSFITAIKAYRTLTSTDLAEAKKYCDRYREETKPLDRLG